LADPGRPSIGLQGSGHDRRGRCNCPCPGPARAAVNCCTSRRTLAFKSTRRVRLGSSRARGPCHFGRSVVAVTDPDVVVSEFHHVRGASWVEAALNRSRNYPPLPTATSSGWRCGRRWRSRPKPPSTKPSRSASANPLWPASLLVTPRRTTLSSWCPPPCRCAISNGLPDARGATDRLGQ